MDGRGSNRKMLDDVAGIEAVSGETSDGYHTFNELYDHRIELFITLCRLFSRHDAAPVWKSKLHSDGTAYDGWFVLGLFTGTGHQITYHLPLSRWNETDFAEELPEAPEWDGHTSADVLKRLKEL